MSLGNPGVECFSIYEPRMNLSNVAQRQYAIVRGGNSITPYIYPSTAKSNSSIQFTCTPPSRSTVLDRIAIVKVGVSLNFTGDAGNTTPLLKRGFDAFRAWPLSSCTNTLVAQINGYGVAIELSKMIHALTRFNEPHDIKNIFLSATTQMDDNCQDYKCVSGTNINPLAPISDNTTYPARGGYPYTLISNTNTAASLTANLYEYLVLPPFIFDGNQSGGLTHLDTLTFTYSLANLQRMWSHCESANGVAGNDTSRIIALDVNITSANMCLFYLTPRLTDMVPATLVYPYYQITNYRSQLTTQSMVYNPDAGQDITSQVIQLQSIPNKIICYVKQSDSIIYGGNGAAPAGAAVVTQTSLTDCFTRINSCRVNWNNINGIYSNSDPIQLWNTSAQNGLSMSFNEWYGSTNGLNNIPGNSGVLAANNMIALTGGIMCFEPGKDLPLRDDEAPGMLGQYNLQIVMNVSNINPFSVTGGIGTNSPLSPELNIICIYEGILTIQDNSTLAQIGVVSKQDALTAPIRYDFKFSALESMYGGNFFTKVRDWVRDKAIPWVKQHGPEIASVAKAVAPLVGLGEGGAALPRHHLRSRLHRI